MATNRNFQFEGMTQIKRKLTNAGFTLIPLRHLMNEHAEVITKEDTDIEESFRFRLGTTF